MNRKTTIKGTLLAALFFLALGGWLLHTRIHPITADEDYLIPFVSGLLSIFIIPWLFWSRRTLPLGYLLNGFSVIIGTITMAHFSIAHFEGALSFPSIFLNTTFADISLLWGKFFVGKALFDLEFLSTDQDVIPNGRFFRYPNWGWWLVHLVLLSIVYALGNILWK